MDITEDTTFSTIRNRLKNAYSEIFKSEDSMRFVFRSKFIHENTKISDIKSMIKETDSIAICPNKITDYKVKALESISTNENTDSSPEKPDECQSNPEHNGPNDLPNPADIDFLKPFDPHLLSDENVQNNEQVQFLVREGYSPQLAFNALIECNGNIDKARKKLKRSTQ